jgi:excisionase family DNA binding protein
MDMIQKLLTVPEAADYLGLTARRVSKFCQEGRLGEKIGRNYLIEPKKLEAFAQVVRPPGNPEFVAGRKRPVPSRKGKRHHQTTQPARSKSHGTG